MKPTNTEQMKQIEISVKIPDKYKEEEVLDMILGNLPLDNYGACGIHFTTDIWLSEKLKEYRNRYGRT